MDVGVAVLLLLGAPLAGAGVLALPAAGRASSTTHAAITLFALVATTVGLIVLFMARPVLGQGAVYGLDLGPLDPARPGFGVAWSLAPPLIAVVFLSWAWRSARPVLVGLALALLGLDAASLLREALGSSEAPLAVGSSALLLDPLAAALLVVSVLVGGLIVVYALGYEPVHLTEHGLPVARTARFLAWLLVFMTAMQLFVLADDLRLVSLGWEVTTLCSVVLIGFDGDRVARSAAERALGYGLLGALGLAAAGLVVGPGVGLSAIVDGHLGAPAWWSVVLAGCILAAATKSALVPFQPWLLGAMVAAAPVSALLHASAMVKAGSYLLLRLAPAFAADQPLGLAVAAVGALSFAGPALLALRTRDLKRILALSTISSLGLMATAAGLGTPDALAAGLLLLMFHAVAKALAFLSVGALEQARATRDLEALAGTLRSAPQLAVPLVIAALALALPPFGIVVAKWALLELGAGDAGLAVLLALGGAANVALWTSVVGRLLMARRSAPAPAGRHAPLSVRLPIAALATGALGSLVLAAPLARLFADPAAQVAFGRTTGLATGWSIALAGGAFAVPAIALLVLAAALAAYLVGRLTHRVAAAPYLSGASLGAGTSSAFHGARGQAVASASGGFYWGEAPPATDGSGKGAAARTGAPERFMTVLGWLAIGLVALAALVSWLQGGPGA